MCVSLLVRRTLLHESPPPLIYSVHLECFMRTLFRLKSALSFSYVSSTQSLPSEELSPNILSPPHVHRQQEALRDGRLLPMESQLTLA